MKKLLLFVALAAVLVPSIAGAGSASVRLEVPERSCGYVLELGKACRVGNLYEITLADGQTFTTHGGDPVPQGFAEGEEPDHSTTGFLAAPIPPVCAGPGEYHHELVYAHPSDVPNGYATVVPLFRRLVAMANGALRESAALRLARADFPMLCDGDGEPVVHNVTLPTASGGTNFGTVINDLSAAGYNSTYAKYWIWFEGPSSWCSCGGIGTVDSDDSAGPANRNNIGPDYGLTFATRFRTAPLYIAVTLMHESGHTMGAVQLSAPNTTGAFHCTDGADVMCYSDGGPKGSQYGSYFCPQRDVYDCNHDDYFDPAPEPGSYLDRHWNLGSPWNAFLRFGSLP